MPNGIETSTFSPKCLAPWLWWVALMDNRKREGPLFSYYGKERQDWGNGGVEEEEEDMFGEDDEIFSMISEESIR